MGLDGRALVAQLDVAGVICSQASACTSAIPEPSHVLTAMGLSEDEAWGSVRFSFSVLNTLEEAQRAAETVVGVVESLLKARYLVDV
jgi:cysteine desulfurase